MTGEPVPIRDMAGPGPVLPAGLSTPALEPLQGFIHWHGKVHGVPIDVALSAVDTVVLCPHAGAALPSVLAPWLAPGLTAREQFDFSDCSTGPLARAWVNLDPHVVAVENPMSRLVGDPNRPPPADAGAALREAFARMRRAGGGAVSLAGVDAVRPITFAGRPVLCEPADGDGWAALLDALAHAQATGPSAYGQAADAVVAHRLAHLASNPAAPLLVISLHDTMNRTMRPDGALAVERAFADRLPAVANLGNRGDQRGEPDGEPVTLEPATLRAMADAWGRAFSVPAAIQSQAITLNRPYKGAHETLRFGALLRPLGRPGVGAVQVELPRELLLGLEATAQLAEPGADWPALDEALIHRLALRLREAGLHLRRQLGAATAADDGAA